MSSEERWIRIENALQTVAERQALHEEHGLQTDQRINALTGRIDTLTQRVDTVTGHVGALAENMIALVHKVDDLSDVVRIHDGRFEKLGTKIDVLVDTVDRLIRRDSGKT